MTWSPQQQAMLAAMGYTLYRQAGAGPAAAAVEAAAPAPVAAMSAGDEPLLRALRRAAGGRDLAGIALPALAALRADAAAKRALWPRLRALRRG